MIVLTVWQLILGGVGTVVTGCVTQYLVIILREKRLAKREVEHTPMDLSSLRQEMAHYRETQEEQKRELDQHRKDVIVLMTNVAKIKGRLRINGNGWESTT